jgi:putrescine aminotransferase
MRAIRDTMVCAPPLTVTEAEIDELVAKARDAIDKTAKDYGKG